MSVGTPLISTDVGGAREVIDDGETALLIPAESPAAIVEAVTSLFKNPDLGKEIALSGQTIVRKRFTIEKMINQQIECYEAWLQPKKDGSRRTI